MNENKSFWLAMLVIFFVIVCVLVAFPGCRTVGSGDTAELTARGYIAVGELVQLDRQLERITERERAELRRIADTASSIEDTIHSVFGIAFRLCDENDSLRAKIAELTKMAEQNVPDPDNLDGPQAGQNNSGFRAAD
jgi:hypothetical protein